MIKPLRRNVLLNLGKVVGPESEYLVIPDYCKGINARGKIVAVGSKCRLFSQADVGREIATNVIKGCDRVYHPRKSKEFGLEEAWHVLADEGKIYMSIDK